MLVPKNNLSKEDILNVISEEDIYARYSFFEQVGKHFLSPFVDERTPSCIVKPYNNYLRFKDFSSGRNGNCFGLLEQKYGLTYSEVLLKIYQDFNLNKHFKANNNLVKKEYIPKEVKIKIKVENWTSYYLDYWKQYGISLNTLKYFDIYPIKYYWINNNRFYSDLAYAYCYGNDKYKILQPNDIDWKWISNVNSDTIQGLNQLKSPSEIIITSSLKDVACIYENLHLQAIAPSSENVLLPKNIIERLMKSGKKITVWFNNDKAGIRAAHHYKEFGFNIFNHHEDLPKDPSDCFKEGYDLEKIWKTR